MMESEMYALFLQDEIGQMVEDAEADSYLDALKIAASWVEKLEPAYSVVIKNLTGINNPA